MSDDPSYGPRGYLPDRAAKRARRKIMLREPLGVGWIAASVAGAVLLAVIAAVYVLTQVGPPTEPYRDAGPIADIDPQGTAVVEVDGTEALVVRGAGGIQVFEAPPAEAVWCRESRRIESADGAVWDPSGQLRGGAGASLRPLPAEAHDGRLYIDPTSARPRPPERRAGEEPSCV